MRTPDDTRRRFNRNRGTAPATSTSETVSVAISGWADVDGVLSQWWLCFSLRLPTLCVAMCLVRSELESAGWRDLATLLVPARVRGVATFVRASSIGAPRNVVPRYGLRLPSRVYRKV